MCWMKWAISPKRCNLSMVELEPVADEEDMMQRHLHSGGDLAEPRPRGRDGAT